MSANVTPLVSETLEGSDSDQTCGDRVSLDDNARDDVPFALICASTLLQVR